MFDYNEFYKKWPVNQHDDAARHLAVAALARGKVLDIGCGTGTLADYFFGPYFGVDISDVAIEKAKEIRRKDASFSVLDCIDLTDFDFSPFQTIVLSEFLEHITNDEKTLNSILTKAKSGTRLIITCPNGPRVPDPSHLRELTVPQLRKIFSPYGKVKFYNWLGANKQILMTCDLGLKNFDLLSLVMIVKNEELGLERAILSCIESVDNIVIAVDDSSSDATAEIAGMYADTLKTFKWSDDFSAARNFAHAGVKTKWILFLDGHEVLAKCEGLEKALESEREGLFCLIEMENGMSFHNPRIYKNGVQFEGKVHEKQLCRSTELYPGALIKHDRLSAQDIVSASEREKQRDDMIPRIMGAELKKNKRNIRASFHLGLHAQSKSRFKEAIKYYKKYLRYSRCKSERWFVYYNISLCYLGLNRFFMAFNAACNADSETPDRWEILKLKGLIFFGKKKFNKAVDCLVDSFKVNTGDVSYKPWIRDDAGTWNLIGECFFQLGHFEKASMAFDRAAEVCTNEKFKPFLEKRAKLMADIFGSQNKSKVE